MTVIVAVSALADDGPVVPVRSFMYPPEVVADLGPSLSRHAEVQPPAIDRSRAYLLEITEEEIVGKPKPVIRNAWDRIRYGFAMPALKGTLVADREDWYRQRKDLVEAMSQKSRRYLYHIVEAVENRGLPMELALLPFVESGFEPTAVSSAKAAGLWQFIPGTAQRYRLKLSDHYDARRDIVASTEAALDYLEFLHGLFNDWHLALAAYNWGEEAVQRAIQRNRAKGLPTDYESLVMPDETRGYVPKLMAMRSVVEDPNAFGIQLADVDNVPYFAGVEVKVELDAKAVARMAGLSVGEVLALNPSHNSSIISGKGKPPVLLPAERIDDFENRLASMPKQRPATRKANIKVDRRAAAGDVGVSGSAL